MRSTHIKRLVVRGSIVGVLLSVTLTSCGIPEIDALFDLGTGDTFGTLIDDRGTFTFNVDNAQISGVTVDRETNAGEFTFGDDDLTILRDEGGQLSFTSAGDDLNIQLFDDPTLGNAAFTVNRSDLGALGDFIPSGKVKRSNLQDIDITCEDGRQFLDDGCDLIAQIDLDALTELIVAELEAQDISIPFASSFVKGFLEDYLGLIIDCCLAWDEFRDAGGDPCDESTLTPPDNGSGG